MEIKDLQQNPHNPRTITDKKLKMLAKALEEYGDLSGIVFNRKTKQLVGGHQRSKVLDQDAEVVIEQKFKKPTRTGTVALGYILINGERFSYREVSWDETKEKAANIAANKGAGDWDKAKLTEWMKDLGESFLDLDLTMFDDVERVKFFDDKPTKKDKDDKQASRSASSDVRSVHLTFTEETADEFAELVGHFQKVLNIDNVTDTVLEVLRLAKDSAE
jgi:hypothetical protein